MNATCVAAPPTERSSVVPSDLGQELTQGFAGRYIGHKARQLIGRYGYVLADLPDLEQELRLRLWQRIPKFDSRRGPWNSFVVAVVDRQLATIVSPHNAKVQWQTLQRLLAQSASVIDDSESSESAQLTEPRAVPRRSAGGDRRDLDLFELRHDMAVVVPRLAPELRIVWEWLQFDTVRRTARALRVSPMTIYRERSTNCIL